MGPFVLITSMLSPQEAQLPNNDIELPKEDN